MGSLISEKVNIKLNEILTQCFFGNRVCDRAMSYLDVALVMPKTASILHDKLAHLFPKLGDVVSDFQGSRNGLSDYGETPADISTYVSAQDFFVKILEFVEDLESLCYDSRDIAQEERDYASLTFIDDFIEDISIVTKQCLLLVDKGEAYAGDWMKFDHDIYDFIILPDFENGEWVD